MKRRIGLHLSLAVMVLLLGARSPADPPFLPTDHYEVRTIAGWTVRVEKGLIEREPELANRTLDLMRAQLDQITKRVNPIAVAKLRAIPIWVEEQEPHHPCMAYHPHPAWLQEHGMNPDKAGCVEVANARNFLKWTKDQPFMVLHELAHGYHHQVLEGGFENREVQAAFDRSIEANRYQSVDRVHGKKQKAYAATNPREYFAETTEAFFGTNDFYPFNRSELEQYDPGMFRLLGNLWHDGE